MKIRSGFVSNSSSSSFLVVLNDSNKHLAHYDWEVTEEEYIYDNEEVRHYFDDDTGEFKSLSIEQFIKENGYTRLTDSKFENTKYSVYTRKRKIIVTPKAELSRCTSICFGKDLEKFLVQLENYSISKSTLPLMVEIRNAIDKYGSDNVLYLRQSDEGQGGFLPEELSELTQSAFFTKDYH